MHSVRINSWHSMDRCVVVLDQSDSADGRNDDVQDVYEAAYRAIPLYDPAP